MHALLRGHWWVAGLLVVASCRSEQAAFSFRPATSVASRAGTAPAPVATQPPTSVSPAAAPASPVAAPAARLLPHATSAPVSQAQRPRFRRLVPAHRREAAAQPQTPARHDTLHIVLGAALVAAGVVAGLLLGGWLGLGVGALVVLLGYYFVVLGIGGQHAWLEIFQEFFNM